MERQFLSQIGKSRAHLADGASFDIAIVGGGIHGAQIARDAQLRGYKAVLLEANDYGYGTSSRSSKLLHGGIRYLEQGEISLVYHALIERARAVALGPHLSRVQGMCYPVVSGQTKAAWQIKAGLLLYDFLSRCFIGESNKSSLPQFPWHSRLSEDSGTYAELRALGIASESIFHFYDGQMDDSRWVLESIVDASELGAVCLNASRVDSARYEGDHASHPWHISWTDTIDSRKHSCRASYLVNVTGPWVSDVHHRVIESEQHDWDTSWPKAVFSRGTHLLFDKPWPHPGLVLPTGERGRVYFVLPYYSPSGETTIVGTTDRQVETNEDNPRASDDEVAELLSYLDRDVPEAGLNKTSMISSFAGMRILASEQSKKIGRKVSSLSRQERLLKAPAYLALLGGKYTTSRRTAEKMCDVIDRHFGYRGRSRQRESTRDRQLPGSRKWSPETVRELLSVGMQRFSAAEDSPVYREVSACVRRFGVRSEELLFPQMTPLERESEPLRVLLERQVVYCMEREFARSKGDLIRRLGLDNGSEESRIFLNYLSALSDKGLPTGR